MEILIGIIIAISILIFIINPNKETFKILKGIGLAPWAKRMRSTNRWVIGGHEILANQRIIKWILLAIMKLFLVTISFFFYLLKISLLTAQKLMPKMK